MKKAWGILFLFLQAVRCQAYLGDDVNRAEKVYGKPSKPLWSSDDNTTFGRYSSKGFTFDVLFEHGHSSREFLTPIDSEAIVPEQAIQALLTANSAGFKWKQIQGVESGPRVWERTDGAHAVVRMDWIKLIAFYRTGFEGWWRYGCVEATEKTAEVWKGSGEKITEPVFLESKNGFVVRFRQTGTKDGLLTVAIYDEKSPYGECVARGSLRGEHAEQIYVPVHRNGGWILKIAGAGEYTVLVDQKDG